MNAGGRGATLITAAAFAALMVCCAVVRIINAAPQAKTIDLAKAQHEVLPWASDESMPFPHAWMMQICCDCGLVHRWLIIPTRDEGVQLYIWRLEPETRKERMRRGTFNEMYHDPWGAENQQPQ
jgi:hypothetical protein